MADRDSFEQPKARGRERSSLPQGLLIAGLVFAAILGAIAVAAFVSGDRQSLEFDYEGFD